MPFTSIPPTINAQKGNTLTSQEENSAKEHPFFLIQYQILKILSVQTNAWILFLPPLLEISEDNINPKIKETGIFGSNSGWSTTKYLLMEINICIDGI